MRGSGDPNRIELLRKKKEQLQRLNKTKSELESGWNSDFISDAVDNTSGGNVMSQQMVSNRYATGSGSGNRSSNPNNIKCTSSSGETHDRNVFIQTFNDMTGNAVAEKITVRPHVMDNRNTHDTQMRSQRLSQQSQNQHPQLLASRYKMIDGPEDDPFRADNRGSSGRGSGSGSGRGSGRGSGGERGNRGAAVVGFGSEGQGQGKCHDTCGDNSNTNSNSNSARAPAMCVSEVACLPEVGPNSVMMSTPRANNDIWTVGGVYTDLDLRHDIESSCVRVNVSDRPLLCMSVYPAVAADVVVGGSDHACYSIDVGSARPGGSPRPKQMHTKRSGHSEWVTSVAHLPNNNVVSVGMDNKVCLWSSARTTCLGEYSDVHFGSISKVLTDSRASGTTNNGSNGGGGAANIALTSGYDGKINIWSFPPGSGGVTRTPLMRGGGVGRGAARGAVAGAGAGAGAGAPVVATCYDKDCGPIVEMCYNQGHIFAGTREGGILMYDISASGYDGTGNGASLAPYRRLQGHGKAVTNLSLLNHGSPCVFVSTGADGLIRLWDSRLERCLVQSINAHPVPDQGGKSPAGPSVTCLLTQCCADSSANFIDDACIISGGSDSLVNVIDVRCSGSRNGNGMFADCSIVNTFAHHQNGIYSMCSAARGVIFSGDGRGMLHCYDIHGSRTRDPGLKYGIGVCEIGAIQCIGVVNDAPRINTGTAAARKYDNHDVGSAGSSRNKIICAGDDGNVSIYNF